MLEYRVIEVDDKIYLEAIKGLESGNLVILLNGITLDADKFLCCILLADTGRLGKTKGPALPSIIGISGAETSTITLSMPKPAKADSSAYRRPEHHSSGL